MTAFGSRYISRTDVNTRQTGTDPASSLEIIFENPEILAVSKPGGLLTQAPSGIDSIEARVKRYLAARYQLQGKVYLGVPHRLDRPASGAIVFAKNKKSARYLAEQFQQRTVGKVYWALVAGEVAEAESIWEDWMRKVPGEARSEICDETTEGAQLARLRYRMLRPGSPTLLEIHLETGRSHQIRLQSSTRGLPLLGDELYGSDQAFGPFSDDARDRWIALHARTLEITDPATNRLQTITAPLPKPWQDSSIGGALDSI